MNLPNRSAYGSSLTKTKSGSSTYNGPSRRPLDKLTLFQTFTSEKCSFERGNPFAQSYCGPAIFEIFFRKSGRLNLLE